MRYAQLIDHNNTLHGPKLAVNRIFYHLKHNTKHSTQTSLVGIP